MKESVILSGESRYSVILSGLFREGSYEAMRSASPCTGLFALTTLRLVPLERSFVTTWFELGHADLLVPAITQVFPVGIVRFDQTELLLP